MKKLRLFASTIALIVFTTASTLAHGGLDSVVFDGDESSEYTEGKCVFKVLQVKGKATGRIQIKVWGGDCEQYYASLVWTDYEQLSSGDMVDADGLVKTYGGAELTLEMPNGAIVVVNAGAVLRFYELCESALEPEFNTGILMNILYGTAKVNMKPSPPGADAAPSKKRGKVRVKTNRLTAEPKGTSYTVDAGAEGGTSDHVVKVYDGAVDVTATTNAVANEMGDLTMQTKALSESFQKGEISQSEFSRKLTELSAGLQEKGTRIDIKPVMVDAGYMVTVNIKGTVSKPKAFDVRKD